MFPHKHLTSPFYCNTRTSMPENDERLAINPVNTYVNDSHL